MTPLLIVVVTFVGYLIAYHTYGKYLARKIFKLDDAHPVPSKELYDGTDYVPTRKGIIFGHHYTSIAGTGPIVGPAIGVIWGWVPALIWVFVGSIVMGAVHDFGALVMSLRNQGKSLSEITGRYVSPAARTVFFLIVFLELLIVIAIFGVVIAAVFAMYPESVFPVWMEIPIAVLLGLAVYKWKRNVTLATAAAVLGMYATVVLGHYLPIEAPQEVFGLSSVGFWVVILLAYAFVASSIPVTTLLQPRDYINAWQLFIAMALLIAGVAVSAVTRSDFRMVASAYNAAVPTDAPPLAPFLFITIACGAISGFHCLVSSGTSPKQVRRESDALFVGYGSMLLEGALAILVIVAVCAGLGLGLETGDGLLTGRDAWNHNYSSWTGVTARLDTKLRSVVSGAANMLATLGIPKGIGLVIIGVFIASFAGTTLDTATRLQRYVIGELGQRARIPGASNRWLATGAAVLTAGGLAFSTRGGAGALVLWPMFGAVNQLLAALALLVISVYLRRRTKRAWLLSFVPCVVMLAITLWAVTLNEMRFIDDRRPMVLILVNGATLVLAAVLTILGLGVLARPREAVAPAAAETTAREQEQQQKREELIGAGAGEDRDSDAS